MPAMMMLARCIVVFPVITAALQMHGAVEFDHSGIDTSVVGANATVGGPCTDGSTPGSNGCCSNNNKCPSGCSSKSRSSNNGNYMCACRGCPGGDYSYKKSNCGLCPDGSDVGSNGCCASTDQCPTTCSSRSRSSSNGKSACSCSGPTGGSNNNNVVVNNNNNNNNNNVNGGASAGAGGPCAGGSTPGSNGCCSNNNKCPSGCSSQSRSSINGNFVCACSGCPGGDIAYKKSTCGLCPDGSDVGSNGCCASTDKCPTTCSIRSRSSSNGKSACSCHGSSGGSSSNNVVVNNNNNNNVNSNNNNVNNNNNVVNNNKNNNNNNAVVNNNPSACVGGGDPHITAFDGAHYTAFIETGAARSGRLELASDDTGEFWLVKNDRVHIQGRYYPIEKGLLSPNIKMIAVGGPFLQGNILIVRPVEIGSIQWNGDPILKEKGAEFDVDGLVNASQAPGLAPVWGKKPWEKVLLQLPMGVSVQVDRNAKALAFKITMRPLEGGQDGQCGNFNGVAADDTKSEIQGRFDWRVERADSLFVAAKVSAA